jgi:hypothetical protein
MFDAETHQHIDEDSDLGRQMMPVRIDRIHRKLDWPILRQKPYQPAGIKIVADQKAWSQEKAAPFERGTAQGLATVGNQVSRHAYRGRHALAVNETPLVAIGIVDVAEAVVRAELGELLHPAMSLDVTVRAAQHMTPGRQAADDQAGIGWRYQPRAMSTAWRRRAAWNSRCCRPTTPPDAWVTAHILAELAKTIPVEQMISWTREPKKHPTMAFGKHRGAKRSDIPIDYLQWMLRQADMDADASWCASQELARRS